MKQFDKAFIATCADCYKTQFVEAETVKECKEVIQARHGWTKTLIGFVCENCSR